MLNSLHRLQPLRGESAKKTHHPQAKVHFISELASDSCKSYFNPESLFLGIPHSQADNLAHHEPIESAAAKISSKRQRQADRCSSEQPSQPANTPTTDAVTGELSGQPSRILEIAVWRFGTNVYSSCPDGTVIIQKYDANNQQHVNCPGPTTSLPSDGDSMDPSTWLVLESIPHVEDKRLRSMYLLGGVWTKKVSDPNRRKKFMLAPFRKLAILAIYFPVSNGKNQCIRPKIVLILNHGESVPWLRQFVAPLCRGKGRLTSAVFKSIDSGTNLEAYLFTSPANHSSNTMAPCGGLASACIFFARYTVRMFNWPSGTNEAEKEKAFVSLVANTRVFAQSIDTLQACVGLKLSDGTRSCPDENVDVDERVRRNGDGLGTANAADKRRMKEANEQERKRLLIANRFTDLPKSITGKLLAEISAARSFRFAPDSIEYWNSDETALVDKESAEEEAANSALIETGLDGIDKSTTLSMDAADFCTVMEGTEHGFAFHRACQPFCLVDKSDVQVPWARNYVVVDVDQIISKLPKPGSAQVPAAAPKSVANTYFKRGVCVSKKPRSASAVGIPNSSLFIKLGTVFWEGAADTPSWFILACPLRADRSPVDTNFKSHGDVLAICERLVLQAELRMNSGPAKFNPDAIYSRSYLSPNAFLQESIQGKSNVQRVNWDLFLASFAAELQDFHSSSTFILYLETYHTKRLQSFKSDGSFFCAIFL